jgi:uncharacterized damage-inducible protein DinB
MTISEVLLLDFDAEIANTRRTLERIPEDKGDWRPHPKSMAMGRLSVHVSRLPEFATRILTSDVLDMSKEKFPDFVFEGPAKLVATLAVTSAEARKALQSAGDEYLLRHWKLSFGDKVIVDAPRALLYRTMFLNHMVHHRAQLGVYLRLNDLPVPGLYGPSNDEPFER